MRLRILFDQNVPRAAAAYLQGIRPCWTVRHVGEVGLWGASDSHILEWAQADESIVITFDEDFADARMFPVGSHCGVIRLRVWPTTIETTQATLDRVLAEVPDTALPGSLIIVDESRIRIRRTIRHG